MAIEWVGEAWGWFNTNRVSATAAAISMGAALAAAAVGINTLKRSKRDSKSRSRPMVGAELVKDEYADKISNLDVRNFGPTVAHNVSVTFEPPLTATVPSDGQPSIIPFIRKRHEDPIPTLMPGSELANIYWDYDELARPADLVTVTISCETADTDRRGRRNSYDDVFLLDLRLFETATWADSSGAPKAQIKKVLFALEKIARSIDAQRRE